MAEAFGPAPHQPAEKNDYEIKAYHGQMESNDSAISAILLSSFETRQPGKSIDLVLKKQNEEIEDLTQETNVRYRYIVPHWKGDSERFFLWTLLTRLPTVPRHENASKAFELLYKGKTFL